MPTVDGRHYPYTKEGVASARAAAKRRNTVVDFDGGGPRRAGPAKTGAPPAARAAEAKAMAEKKRRDRVKAMAKRVGIQPVGPKPTAK